MNARWLLVRHGESVANAEGWLAGWVDAPLTARGRAQAAALSVDMASVTHVWTSDLQRARDTAREITRGAGPRPVEREDLRERRLGEWDNTAKLLLRSEGKWDVLLAWKGRPPGGESQEDCAHRMIRAFAAMDAPGVHLVIGHGTALRTAIGLLDGWDPETVRRAPLANCELVVRDVPIGTWGQMARWL